MSRAAEAGTCRWYVQAAGRVWGPYPESRIAEFVEEGRVVPNTLVGPRPEGPFAPAGHQSRLHRLFGGGAAEAPVGRAATETAPARPLMVWAGLRSQRTERFEILLGAYGPFVQIQPGLWLVRARTSAAGLRNALTRRLDGSDRLMVVEADLAQAAWFNLDAETDRALRQLWSQVD